MKSLILLISLMVLQTVSSHRRFTRRRPTLPPSTGARSVSCEFTSSDPTECQDALPAAGTHYKFAVIAPPFAPTINHINLQLQSPEIDKLFAYYYITKDIARTDDDESITLSYTSTTAEGSTVIAVHLPTTFGDVAQTDLQRVAFIEKLLKVHGIIKRTNGEFKGCRQNRKYFRRPKFCARFGCILSCETGATSDTLKSTTFKSPKNDFRVGLVAFPEITNGDSTQFDAVIIENISIAHD